ncbi:DM13 domain-containing protein [Staphylococcus felis]|uniref:DM13 domain-containing protein n=1 Tax=Staphylococcus felis TaxID=46127 RepID=UPI000E27E588|nr:DM13 domain-containing protein [Staphylococcus felis]REI08856.1 hypothetical protein DOS69_03045 [Staphylococcus felis]
MNIKTTLLATTVATSLLLGACGNDNAEEKKEEHAKSEMHDQKMDKKASSDSMKMGMFKGENKMEVKGHAEIKDNKIMLTDFSSSKGPDLHVYLTNDNDIEKGAKIAPVKFDEKTQSFDLKDVNPNDYNTVTIYCDKAHVIFGSASLAK